MHGMPDIQAVLHDQRTIEAKLRTQLVKLRGIDVALAKHQHHRIAGDQMDQREGKDRDAEECHQHQAKPAREEHDHARSAQPDAATYMNQRAVPATSQARRRRMAGRPGNAA